MERLFSKSLPEALSRKASGLGVYMVTPEKNEKRRPTLRLPAPNLALLPQSAVIAFGFVGLFIGPTLLAVGYSLMSGWTHTRNPIVKQEGEGQP